MCFQKPCLRASLGPATKLHVFFRCFAMPPKSAGVAANAADEETAISLAIEAMTRDLRNYRRREAREKCLPDQVGHCARLLLWKTSGDQRMLAKFLQWKAPREKDVLAAWVESLQKWYTELPPGLDVAIGGKTRVQIQRNSMMLDTFFKEERLHAWVQHQNENLGISPGTATVLKQLRSTELDIGRGRAVPRRSRNYRSSLQYLRRWRRRWGISKGSFQPLDLDPPEVMRSKVCVSRPALQGETRNRRLASLGTQMRPA